MMPKKAEFDKPPLGHPELGNAESSNPELRNPELVKPESAETIWLIVLSPAIWSVHFMASYLTAAIWCAKFGDSGSSFQVVRISIAVYTVLALIGIGAVGWLGHTRHRARTVDGRSHYADTAGDRHRFLGFATLLLSVLSAVATVFVALAAVFIGSCD